MRTLFMSIFMVGGLFFFMVGTLGILRFPDVFTRAHSAAKCDTLGALLCLVGLIIFSGFNFISLKILFILIFIWITNPIATHLIARAEYYRNIYMKEMIGVNDNENF